MTIIENIQQKASFLNNLKENETALFEFINSNHSNLVEVIEQYKPEKEFKPVNTLRFLIANELQKGTVINKNIIDKLKNALENRDVSDYYILNDSVKQGLINYKISKIGMFPNWKHSFNILFPFIHNTSENEEVKTQLNHLADEIIDINQLENVTKHIVSFQGSNNYGTDWIWLAILPESSPSVQYAYQIFINIDKKGLIGGIHKGHNLIKQEFENQDIRYDNWQDFLERTKQIKDEWLQLNSSLNFIFIKDENEFKKALKTAESSSLTTFFETLDRIKEDINFLDEENLVFSVARNRMSFQVGKRYCLALVKNKFRFITSDSHIIDDLPKENFTAPANAFLYNNASSSQVVTNYDAIKNAVESELERDNHTEPKTYDNSAFRKAVFDKEYRSKILKGLGIISLNKAIMKNIKQDFIDWYIANPRSSYFNNDPHKLSDYLTKSEENFSKDIFLVDSATYREMIDFIEETINHNKNKFLKNHGAPDSGKLAAIVGKKNYQKFLKEYFNKTEHTDTKITIKHKAPINQILYGPPGTGKTFYLKDQLFEKYTSRETSISDEQQFEMIVSDCSWWQVIAIALLDLKEAKVSDIFNHKWVQKKASLSNSNTIRPTLWGQLQSHTVNECEFVKVSNRQQPLLFEKTEDSYWKILEEQVEELVPELYDLKDSVENYNPDPDKIIKHFDFVTFHQSFAYEDFIEGIKPIIPEIDSELEEAKDLGYTIEDGVFKNLCLRAKNDPNKRYAIFIDEINRGNVSAIFGELITLIEIDKRKGAKNEMSIKLPYSKKEFSVPSNLDIYGTMNTADRSVEALDTALRRRFEFKEMMPDYNVIEDEFVEGVQLFQVLQTINERIELLIDRDHTIGHSFFVNVNTKQKLANAFNNRIVPLLQEYFYGDYGKIGLVLGKGFVEKFKNDNIDFASFDYENANDFKIASYKLKQVNTDNVIDAIEILLGLNETVLK